MTDYEIFNPSTGTFSSPSSSGISGPIRAAAAAPILDSAVLLVGGTENGTTFLTSGLIYNGLNWGGRVDMETPRLAPGAASLPDGGALVVGGQSGPFTYLSSAERFDPTAVKFTSAGVGSLSTPRGSPAVAPLPDGRVLVAGGFDGSNALSSAEIYAATNTFSFKLKGKRILVTVQATGKVTVSDAAAPLSASTAKKRKLLLKPSSGSGDPPTIPVTLHLSKLGKSRLRQRGKLTVRARITFAPQGGVANTQIAKLKIRSKIKSK
jgi:hypothetical protein